MLSVRRLNNLQLLCSQVFYLRTFFLSYIKEYLSLVVYIENDDEIFLKTIIPIRKFTKKYLG